jgi:hypothetical protein
MYSVLYIYVYGIVYTTYLYTLLLLHKQQPPQEFLISGQPLCVRNGKRKIPPPFFRLLLLLLLLLLGGEEGCILIPLPFTDCTYREAAPLCQLLLEKT